MSTDDVGEERRSCFAYFSIICAEHLCMDLIVDLKFVFVIWFNSFHGAFCLSVTILTFTGAVSSIILTNFE